MNTTNLVQRVLDLTLEMEHAALMSDWSGAARLARVRNPLLMSIGLPQPPEARAAIERIRAITVAVNQEAAVARTELTEQYRATMGQASAAQAYLSAARF